MASTAAATCACSPVWAQTWVQAGASSSAAAPWQRSGGVRDSLRSLPCLFGSGTRASLRRFAFESERGTAVARCSQGRSTRPGVHASRDPLQAPAPPAPAARRQRWTWRRAERACPPAVTRPFQLPRRAAWSRGGTEPPPGSAFRPAGGDPRLGPRRRAGQRRRPRAALRGQPADHPQGPQRALRPAGSCRACMAGRCWPPASRTWPMRRAGAHRAGREGRHRARGGALIPNNASLFINIGTTTEEVARCLKDHAGPACDHEQSPRGDALYPLPKIEVIVAGGPVRRSDGGIVGAAAIDLIRQFKVDYRGRRASARDRGRRAARTSTTARCGCRAPSWRTPARRCWWPTACNSSARPRCASAISAPGHVRDGPRPAAADFAAACQARGRSWNWPGRRNTKC